MIAVGVLGGSFDPVHRGHVALACHAHGALGLDGVVLLPCADPPHKPDRTLAAPFHRLEMLHLAAEDRPGIRVSTYEIARPGVHYTIDTLRVLRSASPALAPVFLCGSDALAEIDSWRDHHHLLAEFDFAAVVRPPGAGGEVAIWPSIVTERVVPLPAPGDPPVGAGGRIFVLSFQGLDVSSSLVRRRRAEDAVLDDLVPDRVARYIQRHRLYTEEAAR